MIAVGPRRNEEDEGRMLPMTSRLREIIEGRLERTTALDKATGRVSPWLFHRNGQPIKFFRRAWLTVSSSSHLIKGILMKQLRPGAVFGRRICK